MLKIVKISVLLAWSLTTCSLSAMVAKPYPEIVFYINKIVNKTDGSLDITNPRPKKIILSVPAKTTQSPDLKIEKGDKMIETDMGNYEIYCSEMGGKATCELGIHERGGMIVKKVSKAVFDLKDYKEDISGKTIIVKALINIVFDGRASEVTLEPRIVDLVS